jgi:crotonobetainyl-CoA:carnitine CoA-transferase CaiB-like acyl-CoA transferase
VIKIERLGQASIAFGLLNSVKEFSQHPALKLLAVDTSNGAVELITPPGFEDNMTRSRVPGLGEHSESIRAEFCEIRFK